MSEYQAVTYEVLDNVARISHARPEVRNAQNQQLIKEMNDAFSRVAADDFVRVVILAGQGDHFFAGHDLKEAQARKTAYDTEERWAFEQKFYYDACLRIHDFPKPTIAQVQGACIAARFMVANMCDLMVASDDAFFADPVVHTLAAAAVEVLVHPWVLGHRKAREMLFTGERLSAQEALARGMVSCVVPRERLEKETLALARRVAEAPPFAVHLLRRSLNRTLDLQGFRTSLHAHFETHQISHATTEYRRCERKGA